MLENTEEEIKNGHSSETVNIGYTRQRIPQHTVLDTIIRK
jgi:hypothetical protein